MGLVRMTKQREIILDELKKLKTHPTAAELYELLRKKMPKISLGTVYRNLEILAEMGIVRKLEIAGKEKRWDGDISPHYHMRCEKCGRVFDLFLKEEDMFNLSNVMKKYIPEEAKFQDLNLEVVGICPDCNKSNN